VLPEQVQAVSPSTDAVAVSVWDEAPLPTSPTSPNTLRNGGLGLLLGCVLGIVLAFLMERLGKRRFHSPEQVEQISGVPTFGVIPRFSAPNVPRDNKKQGEY
jgi:capsular polysaccharide biosynthesis protein